MDRFEEQLRAALHTRAQSARPNPSTWDEVTRRISRRRFAAWAAPATAVAAVAAVAVLVVPGLLPASDDIDFEPGQPDASDSSEGSVADQPDDQPSDMTGDGGQSGEQPTPSDEVADDAAGEPVEDGPTAIVFYVRSTPDRFWVEPAEVPIGTDTLGVARAAIEALVAGAPEGLETLAPTGTRVLGAAVRDGVLRIDLSADVRQGQAGAQGEELFAQQLAHTATQFEGIDAVRLLVEGQEVAELWGHIGWAEPITSDVFVLSPVTIEDVVVEDGQVTVSGQSMTYEGTVELELVDPSGDVVDSTFTTAVCGAPCRGAWSYTFEPAGGGAGTWLVRASEPSVTPEGRDPFMTEADIIVE